MLTKQQKQKEVKVGLDELQKSQSLIFVDFGKLPTSDIRKLRSILREMSAKMKVIKKRLLKIVLQQGKVNLDPTQFESQVGTIFVPSDIYGIAGKVYKFVKDLAKEKKDLKVLGAYDLKDNKVVSVEEFIAIAKVPSREILLAQIAIMLTVPVKKVMIALNGRKAQLETK